MFRRDQVLSAAISEFLLIYDPTKLSPFQLRSLFGRLSLEIQDAVKYGNAATNPEARKLVTPETPPKDTGSAVPAN